MVLVLVLAPVLTLVSLAACGGPGRQPAGPAVPSGPPVIHPAWTSCAEAVLGPPSSPGAAPSPSRPAGHPDLAAPWMPGTAALGLPRLPPDWDPAAVVVCDAPTAGPGLEERRGTGIAELVRALRLPDEPLDGGVCPAVAVVVPWFALLAADGSWLRPGVPADGCGMPRAEVREALERLALDVVRRSPG
ncbi:hypothetical protein GCM10010399_44770 [Dactylosporangium fulvum]|uniref:Uncharacterized protein n=1 Tax=Dactylosporangium fulvum TaxID=53359 RepID=A0ABY5W9H1_9ACTN|nr:hypothetical protein [Dactylosporangium fulvum]UWP86139.1 hypothetical protein Dfulv_18595 [Dactylosporangium fulvum]